MLADPVTVTIGGSSKSLVRINQDGYSSEYLLVSTTDEIRMKVRNSTLFDKSANVTRNRHNIELSQIVYPVAGVPAIQRKAYIVFENQQGDTLTDPVNVAAALCSFLTASTNAVLTKTVNFES